ncbi:TIGR03862 family flavoprotein, partial [Sulfitobacter sp.]|nr:TIGR03862 family flavoprotein [Sulfitobacter sp.]
MKHAVVIGSGPAGLMAAEVMAKAGIKVTICEAKPSVGRKFLMAGKSGLNLTKEEESKAFHVAFTEATRWLAPMLDAFGPDAVQTWARDLEQELFTGTTGRVFPKAMKASPLLRAWLVRLGDLDVTINTCWRWTGWEGAALAFDTPDGIQSIASDVTVLALGGASWQRLGSDGAWYPMLLEKGLRLTPFAPANAGLSVAWSPYMEKHLGTAIKSISLTSGPYTSRGEAILSRHGIEGGGIYS